MNDMETTSEEALYIGRFLRARINLIDSSTHARERPHWTESVKCAFSDYSKDRGFKNNSEVLPPIDLLKPGSRKDEFLVDFVLWRRDIDGSKEGAWIACESEWDRDYDGILKDFNKLLSFRAPYKVMIYDIKKEEKLGMRLRQGFKECLERFYWHIKGEAYIFIEFVDGARIAEIYICLPEKDSTLHRAYLSGATIS